MSTVTKGPLSGSSHGDPVVVVATAIASGDTIHTATSGTTDADCDFVTIYAFNGHSADVELTLGIGGTTDPDHLVKQTIPVKAGLSLVLLRHPLRSSNVIKAAASVASKIVLIGDVLKVR